MAFQPSTNLYIGTVPFAPDYRHVMDFPSRSAQHSYFSSVCPQALRRGDYTYQRVDNAVVVPFNAEILYGYNYCMFQNENYGNRWFYSFITDIEYVNPESSRLVLSLDLYQTWFMDCTVKPCFVEREHVDDDTPGTHIRDEGIDPGELRCVQTQIDGLGKKFATLVASLSEPTSATEYENTKPTLYANVATGAKYTAFLLDDGSGESQFIKYMSLLASNGQQGAISAIWMVPRVMLPGLESKENGLGSYVASGAMVEPSEVLFACPPLTLGGYKPRNNKLFCYPFQYVELTNGSGGTQELRLEFFENFGFVKLERNGGFDVNSKMTYIPLGYNGKEKCYENALDMPPYPTCTWAYETANNILGQSAMNFNVADFLSPVFKAYASQTAVGVPDIPFSINSTKDWQFGIMPVVNLISGMLDSKTPGEMASGLIDGGIGMFEAKAALSKIERQPSTTKGGTNSSIALANMDYYQLTMRRYSCRREIAEQIDSFFDMYGYNVSLVKKPNLTGRANWNYVKTSGANVTGKAPAPALTFFNKLLDRGVTIWHTSDVGNYALPNGIV